MLQCVGFNLESMELQVGMLTTRLLILIKIFTNPDQPTPPHNTAPTSLKVHTDPDPPLHIRYKKDALCET